MLQDFPVITVKVEAQFDGSKKKIPVSKSNRKEWVDLPPGKEMAFVFTITRENRPPKDLKVYAPKFPKV